MMTRSHWWWALALVLAVVGAGALAYSSPFLAVPLVNHFLHGFFANASTGHPLYQPRQYITDATAQAVAPILALVAALSMARHLWRGRRRASL